MLASKINQSAVVGEILVGVLIGPSILGLITYTDFIKNIAHLGAIILLFVIGLEFQLKDIIKLKYAVIAFVGIVVPWFGGYFLANLFGFNLASAVFVGAALTATSIAITANVLKELGKLQTEAARAIISAAVLDDILALLALSISGHIALGTFSYIPIIVIFLKAIIFLLAGFFIGYIFLGKFIIKIDNAKIVRKYDEFVFIFAIMLAFLYAFAAELIGLSAIVGSFIAGVSLSSGIADLKHSKNYKDGAEYLHIIFASIFFISLGILADFNVLTFNTCWFLIALTIVAIFTKVIGCGLTAKIEGMNTQDSLIVGFGMSPRGEVAMVIALIGLTQGIIKQEIYVSLVLMSLLTTIITPIILRNWLYKKQIDLQPCVQ